MNPPELPTVDVTEIPADAILLDVREEYEWNAGHIDGAIHVPMNEVPQRLSFDPGPLTLDATIVVACKMGGRSAQVTAWMIQNGYNAMNLEGGMLAWATGGKLMISEDGTPPQIA